jgi:hypothetical protein
METADKSSFATATNSTTAVETGETPHELRCVRCDAPFEPRRHGGGKPQKYCGEKCRTADYAEKQRQEINRQGGLPSKPEDEPHSIRDRRPRGPSSGADDYDWQNGAVVVGEQQAIAIYLNGAGNLVIRQRRAWDEEHDCCIIIHEHNAERLLVELSHFISSAGQ